GGGQAVRDGHRRRRQGQGHGGEDRGRQVQGRGGLLHRHPGVQQPEAGDQVRGQGGRGHDEGDGHHRPGREGGQAGVRGQAGQGGGEEEGLTGGPNRRSPPSPWRASCGGLPLYAAPRHSGPSYFGEYTAVLTSRTIIRAAG